MLRRREEDLAIFGAAWVAMVLYNWRAYSVHARDSSVFRAPEWLVLGSVLEATIIFLPSVIIGAMYGGGRRGGLCGAGFAFVLIVLLSRRNF